MNNRQTKIAFEPQRFELWENITIAGFEDRAE